MKGSKAGLAVAVAVLLAVGITGCTNGAASSGSVSFSGPRAATAAGGSSSRAGAAKSTDRSVVLTGSLSLTAADPVGAARRIGDVVAAAGGHLDSDDEQPGSDPHADLVARIPAAAFEATLPTIERTGSVRSVSLHSSDVTAQVTDYAVRIGALEASVTRLTALLGRAADTSDLVGIEGALTSRESDLESLQAQQRGLAAQVSFASLTIGIVAPAAVGTARPTTFGSGLAAGWAALAASIDWLAVAVGVLLPWLVVLAVPAGLALLAARLARRRRRPVPGP